MKSSNEKAYTQAGVDIDLADALLDQVKPVLKKATRPESLGSIGGFGGFFDISKLKQKQPVLVSSTDSVGTKVTAARLADDYSNLGADIVNHCSNDVAVCGAEPLYFLDYYATGKLNKNYVTLLKGLAKACQAGNIALVGGETAELPGVYASGECDLVGTIVGVVDKPKILTGKAVKPGDVLIGLKSSGLHTNGFSLARKVLFAQAGLNPFDKLPGTRSTIGKALLAPHVNYAPFILEALKQFNNAKSANQRKDNLIYGMAHITGGGFTGNIPRVLPENCQALVNTSAWKPLPIFTTINEIAKLPLEEAYEVFNMGIGLVMIADPSASDGLIKLAAGMKHKATIIGEVKKGEKGVGLV